MVSLGSPRFQFHTYLQNKNNVHIATLEQRFHHVQHDSKTTLHIWSAKWFATPLSFATPLHPFLCHPTSPLPLPPHFPFFCHPTSPSFATPPPLPLPLFLCHPTSATPLPLPLPPHLHFLCHSSFATLLPPPHFPFLCHPTSTSFATLPLPPHFPTSATPLPLPLPPHFPFLCHPSSPLPLPPHFPFPEYTGWCRNEQQSLDEL